MVVGNGAKLRAATSPHSRAQCFALSMGVVANAQLQIAPRLLEAGLTSVPHMAEARDALLMDVEELQLLEVTYAALMTLSLLVKVI